jgi:hypothetical protein
VSDERLVSLDDYSCLVWKDPEKKLVAVTGGPRVRDVVALLLEEWLAFRALSSHDAQSIARILSTDRLSEENGHLSLYLCSPSRTEEGPSGDLREFVRTSIDALGAAWIGNLIAYTRLLCKVSSLVYGVEPDCREQQSLQQDALPLAPGAGVHQPVRGRLRLHAATFVGE